MALRTVRVQGDPVLGKRCREVREMTPRLRELVEEQGCRFQEDLTWGEDFAFVMDYLAGVRQVSFMNESLYDYRRTAGSTSVRQVLDCVKHPAENTRIKGELYRHLKDMYRKRGLYKKYRKRLWMYLFRVGLG